MHELEGPFFANPNLGVPVAAELGLCGKECRVLLRWTYCSALTRVSFKLMPHGEGIAGMRILRAVDLTYRPWAWRGRHSACGPARLGKWGGHCAASKCL